MKPPAPYVHHVGIVMPSLARAVELMELLGLTESYRGDVASYEATCIFTQADVGSPVEFVVPNGGPLATFNRGAGGLHHVAIEVHSLEAVASDLAARGLRLLEAAPVPGAGPFVCNFLAPGYANGVIVEFIESTLGETRDGGSDVLTDAPTARVEAALQFANGTRDSSLILTTDTEKRIPC